MKLKDKPCVWVYCSPSFLQLFHDRTKEEMLTVIRRKMNKFGYREVTFSVSQLNSTSIMSQFTTKNLNAGQYVIVWNRKKEIIIHRMTHPLTVNDTHVPSKLRIDAYYRRRTE